MINALNMKCMVTIREHSNFISTLKFVIAETLILFNWFFYLIRFTSYNIIKILFYFIIFIYGFFFFIDLLQFFIRLFFRAFIFNITIFLKIFFCHLKYSDLVQLRFTYRSISKLLLILFIIINILQPQNFKKFLIVLLFLRSH